MSRTRLRTSKHPFVKPGSGLLVLFRHGHAEDRDTARQPEDDLRPLTAAGRKRAKASARALRKLGVSPDRILFSPSLRTRETADIVAEAFHLPKGAVILEPSLHPDADPGVLARKTSRAMKGDASARGTCVLWVGHEPGLGETVGLLTGGPPVPLRKAGIALLELSGGRKPAVLKALMPPEWLAAVG